MGRIVLSGQEAVALLEALGRQDAAAVAALGVESLDEIMAIYLGGSGIAALPPELGQLTNLERLDLSNTPIASLPPSLGGLSKLKRLSLDYTKIQTVPGWIKELKALRFLSMKGLRLRELPRELFALGLPYYLRFETYREKARANRARYGEKKGIILEGTELRTQPISLFGLDRAMIRAYYDEEKRPVREGKVIFLGDGGAGKSHSIERILKDGADRDIHTDQTPGINIRSWAPVSGGRQLKINFWDFGGQEILHAMHRCFLTGRSLYVVVLRERSESRHNDLSLQAQYWLENIQSFAPNCPVILAVNREQGVFGSGAINSRKLREAFPNIVGAPIEYCAREDQDDNFQTLTERILREVLRLDSSEMDFPRSWSQVRSELENMSNRRDRKGSRYYIDQEEYRRICAEQGISDENIRRWLLEWFNDLGVCFSYHQEAGKELERYQVLNPEWLTNAIYAIIQVGKGPDFSRHGVITRTEIDGILRDPGKFAKARSAQTPIRYDWDEQGYVLEIMKKFHLCAQLNEREYFIPALCPMETPEDFRPAEGAYTEHTRFELRYSFLPDSVIHRLMIACIQGGFHRRTAYFSGIRVDFEPDEISLTVESDPKTNHLTIDIYHRNDPDSCRKKLAWVRRRLDAVNASMNLKPEREILVIWDGADCADLALDFLFSLLDDGEHRVRLPAYREGKNLKCKLDDALRLLYDERTILRADRIRRAPLRREIIPYRDALAMAEAELAAEARGPRTEQDRKFAFGISFAGEERDFAAALCVSLCERGGWTREEIFYDSWHEHLINGANGDLRLDKVYSEQCRQVIVLFSQAYLEKHWTRKLEWTRAITARITADPDNVCLLRYGSVDIDSVPLLHANKDIVKDVSAMDPEEVADFILRWSQRPPL